MKYSTLVSSVMVQYALYCTMLCCISFPILLLFLPQIVHVIIELKKYSDLQKLDQVSK